MVKFTLPGYERRGGEVLTGWLAILSLPKESIPTINPTKYGRVHHRTKWGKRGKSGEGNGSVTVARWRSVDWLVGDPELGEGERIQPSIPQSTVESIIVRSGGNAGKAVKEMDV